MTPKAYVPPPKGDPNFPARMWHPESGESAVFHNAADVPEGWLDTHPNNAKRVPANAAPAQPAVKAPAPDKKGNGLPMTREQITIALLEGGVQFKRSSDDKALYATLMTALKKVLDDQGVKYDPKANAPALLELLPKPE